MKLSVCKSGLKGKIKLVPRNLHVYFTSRTLVVGVLLRRKTSLPTKILLSSSIICTRTVMIRSIALIRPTTYVGSSGLR